MQTVALLFAPCVTIAACAIEPTTLPPGNYRVAVEMTDKNGTGPSITMPFTMNDTPMTLMPPETTNFHDLLIELQ